MCASTTVEGESTNCCFWFSASDRLLSREDWFEQIMQQNGTCSFLEQVLPVHPWHRMNLFSIRFVSPFHALNTVPPAGLKLALKNCMKSLPTVTNPKPNVVPHLVRLLLTCWTTMMRIAVYWRSNDWPPKGWARGRILITIRSEAPPPTVVTLEATSTDKWTCIIQCVCACTVWLCCLTVSHFTS